MNFRVFAGYLLGLLITLVLLFLPYLAFDPISKPNDKVVRVMTYSSFIQSWGAGPKIAQLFESETGYKVEWINAGNAGLIVERLKFKRESDQPDLIVGLDQFSIHEARRLFSWADVHVLNDLVQDSQLPKGAQFFDFVAYDWGPMTFIYKEGLSMPPESLDDLLSTRYQNQLLLQDPRMSSPGMQFLLWVLVEKGVDEGLRFLEKLKPSIKVMSPSWSSSYSLFKMQQPSLVFSYFTSPLFHKIEEQDRSYKAAAFKNPHPVQVEYAGIPASCGNCEGARRLAQFLLRPDIQKILMSKNYMFPVDGRALKGSEFEVPKNIRYLKPIESLTLIKKKESW